MQTDLFLVRHGETRWNAEARLQGHQDSPLTARGIAQAKAAAVYLSRHALTALYSSDLPRTLQTAAPIAAATNLDIFAEPALRERNLGIFEGLTRTEIQARHGTEFSRYAAREAEFVIPNGESLAQLDLRGRTILRDIARRHAGRRVAVVSHGALLTTFLRYLHGIELHLPRPFVIANGSISHVRYDHDRDRWTIISQGETPQLSAATG